MTENTQNNTALSVENVRGVPFKKGFDERRNLEGKPEGTKNFSTIFEQAIKKIAKDQNIDVNDAEQKMVVVAILNAFRGNFKYYQDIMDRLYGSTKKGDTLNLGVQVNNTPWTKQEMFGLCDMYKDWVKEWHEQT